MGIGEKSMSSIDRKEIRLMKEWAGSHENKDIFDELFLGDKENTYFSDIASQEDYIMEYGFNDLMELEEMFTKHWKNRTDVSVKKIAAVSAFKYRHENDENTSSHAVSDGQPDGEPSKLPEYIYVF